MVTGMCSGVPRTGDVCERTGLYESACDQGHFRYYKRGQHFEACRPCDLGVDWFPVKAG